MNKEKTTISLELLLLNDLLRTKAIDKELYDRAAQKIVSIRNSTQVNGHPMMLATA